MRTDRLTEICKCVCVCVCVVFENVLGRNAHGSTSNHFALNINVCVCMFVCVLVSAYMQTLRHVQAVRCEWNV